MLDERHLGPPPVAGRERAREIDIVEGLTLGQQPRHPDSLLLDPGERRGKDFLARDPLREIARTAVEEKDARPVVRRQAGNQALQRLQGGLPRVRREMPDVDEDQEIPGDIRFLVGDSRREVRRPDRTRVDPGEVVDRHRLSAEAHREVLAREVRHGPAVTVGHDDVQVHDADLHLLGEGRRFLREGGAR